MPNVGPMDGWRIATVARLPLCANAWPSPTVVVALPSPRGLVAYHSFPANPSGSMPNSRPASSSASYR
jgi:hypothetical protein